MVSVTCVTVNRVRFWRLQSLYIYNYIGIIYNYIGIIYNNIYICDDISMSCTPSCRLHSPLDQAESRLPKFLDFIIAACTRPGPARRARPSMNF